MPCSSECGEIESLVSLNPHNLLGVVVACSCDHDFSIPTSQVVDSGLLAHASQGEHLLDYKLGRRVERGAQCRSWDAVSELRLSARLLSDTTLVCAYLAEKSWPGRLAKLVSLELQRMSRRGPAGLELAELDSTLSATESRQGKIRIDLVAPISAGAVSNSFW